MNAREEGTAELRRHVFDISPAGVMQFQMVDNAVTFTWTPRTPAPAVREPQPGERVRCYGHTHVRERLPDGTEAVYQRPSLGNWGHWVKIDGQWRHFARVEVITPEPAPDAEPCDRCGGDRLRTDFNSHTSGRCHMPVLSDPQQPAPTPGEHQGGGVVDEPEVGVCQGRASGCAPVFGGAVSHGNACPAVTERLDDDEVTVPHPEPAEATDGDDVEALARVRDRVKQLVRSNRMNSSGQEYDGGSAEAIIAVVLAALPGLGYSKAGDIDVVFDGPPGHESGRFIEVETPDGQGIGVGTWSEDPTHPGWWRLRLRAALDARTVTSAPAARENGAGG